MLFPSVLKFYFSEVIFAKITVFLFLLLNTELYVWFGVVFYDRGVNQFSSA